VGIVVENPAGGKPEWFGPDVSAGRMVQWSILQMATIFLQKAFGGITYVLHSHIAE
jgi:hypothetical protein